MLPMAGRDNPAPAETPVDNRPELRILITGGGTGGHVSPALAVVQTIRAMESTLPRRPVFCYLGSFEGVERGLAAEAGIDFTGVHTGKLRRSRRWWGMINRRNTLDLFKVPVGIAQAFGVVWRFRPHVVLATGGYVSVPPVIAAGLSGLPVLIHEQTVQVGLANRIAGVFSTRIALSYECSAAELPNRLRRKSFVTGNPVRSVIFDGDRDRGRHRLGFPDDGLPTIYVTGGSMGARVLNRAVGDVLPELLTRAKVIHQCGRQSEGSDQDLDMLSERYHALPADLQRRYYLTAFVREEIGDVFAVSDLVVGRSGAGTVSEVCALGKPAIFVPLVPTGGDEQTRNARLVEEAGGAMIIRNADLTGRLLVDTVAPLLADPARLRAMSVAARTLATPDAARDITAALLALAEP